MQSDTIIGIVGAAVLVAVMVGVFVFEYNNAPGGTGDGDGDDGLTDAEKKAAFNETYPGLASDDDIDGDGTPNWNDTDIDGDGTANGNDTDIEVSFDLSHAAPANTNAQGSGPASSGEILVVGEGFTAYTIEVSHATGTVGTFRVQADAGDAGQCTTGDGGTCEIPGTTQTAPDDYPVTLRQTSFNNNELQVTVTATVTYA